MVKRSISGWLTLLGAFCVVLFLLVPVIWLCGYGESFFSLTRRLPAEVLVVEGWIGRDGVRAGVVEFEQHGYQYIVATGGLPEERRQDNLTYAEMAARELIGAGISKDKVIIAATAGIEHQRTFQSAVAVWHALRMRGIYPRAISVFTLGPHARRSRLVFAKVHGQTMQVGVVAWAPPEYKAIPWWQSGERTKCFLKEIVGYPYELLANSGRISNSPDNNGASSDIAKNLSSGAKMADP